MRFKLMGSVVGLLALVLVAGCVHTELIWREFDGETLYIDARVPPNPTIDASYFAEVDEEDPIGTIVNIGTSTAKAIQVESAGVRLSRALARIELGDVIRDELGDFFAESMGMEIVTSRSKAAYRLVVDVDRFGINAYGGTYYVLDGQSELFAQVGNVTVWGNWFSSQQEISPDYFDLPDSAEHVISTVTLASLDEETMVRGIDHVARQAAWQIGTQFDHDLYRARLER